MKNPTLLILALAVAQVKAEQEDLTSDLARVGAKMIAGFKYTGTLALPSANDKNFKMSNGTIEYFDKDADPSNEKQGPYIAYAIGLKKDVLSRNGAFAQFNSMQAREDWIRTTFDAPKVMDFTASQNIRIERNENVLKLDGFAPSATCHNVVVSMRSWNLYKHDDNVHSDSLRLHPALIEAGLLKKDTMALCHSPPGEQQYFVSDSYVVGEKSPRKLLWVCHFNHSKDLQDLPLKNRVFCHSVQTAVFNPYVDLAVLQ